MKKAVFFVLCLLLVLSGCDRQEAALISTGEFTFDTGNFSDYVNIADDGVWDLRPAMDTELCYLYLSSQPLEEDDSVMLMFTGACEYTASECADTEFPFWLYQTYRGVDWNEVAALAEAAENGDADAEKKLSQYETLYLEDYQALSAEDISPLYGYWITNNITSVSVRTARYEQVPLLMGEEEVTLDVGCLEVSSLGWDQCLTEEGVEDVYGGRLTAATASYWGDGIVTMAPIILAKEDTAQTLRGLTLYGIDGEILDIQVSFGGSTQSWDGASDLEIPADTTAKITVTLQTQANQVVGYCEDANIAVQREINGQAQRLWYFASISQSWNIYELYAMAVDGLDIAAYYAYATDWKQPEGIAQPQSEALDFTPVTVADTEDYCITVTGITWDDWAYTLHLTAENRTTQTVELCLGSVYLNNWYFGREREIPLEPGQQGDFTWHIPWEAMAEYGVDAQTGTDIRSVEFICNALYNGALPRDENGYLIIYEAYTCIYPLGTEAAERTPVSGELILETEEIRLYFVGFEANAYSALDHAGYPRACKVELAMENIRDGSVSFVASDFRMDGTRVDGIAAGTFRSGSCYFCGVALATERTELGRLTFSLALNNSETYTVTVNGWE